MLLGFTNRQIDSFIFAVQGVATIFCALFITVYLLGLRDLPKNVVYHSEPTFRAALSVFGILTLFLFVLAILLSFLARRKQ
jgi:hypothetical protein